MKKQLLNFCVLCVLASFISCSQEKQPVQSLIKELRTKEGKSIVITPEMTSANSQFAWYKNGELISTDETFTFEGETEGVEYIELHTQTRNGVEAVTNYKVNVVPYNADYVTLNLDTYTLNSTNGISTTGGYYWNQTYYDTKFQHQIFTFSHTGGGVSGYAYWDGFTVSNSKDNTNHGAPGNSNGWLNYQWGCMDNARGKNFLVGYWGYYMKDFQASGNTFSESQYSNWVKIENGTNKYKAVSVQISIHPWPYYGCLSGDGFARKFVKGDYFRMFIYGVGADNKIKPNPVVHYLADYRGNSLIMPTTWQDVNISTLGEVKYLMFQMESTDEMPPYGPNTAVYFNMKGLTVDKI